MVRRLLGRCPVGVAALLCLAAVGCGGGSKFLEDEEWTHEQAPDGGVWREAESLFSPEESDVDRFDNELNGVRLDLTMSAEAQPTAACRCVDVAVGRPADSGFVWGPERPVISPDQMVVAVRAGGKNCPATVGEPAVARASIKAVDTRGKNVIVVIEKLPEGRPLARGAITTRPKPGGTLYVRAANKHVPYGGSIGGKGMCKVFTRPAASR